MRLISDIPEYAAIDLAKESSPGPSNMILVGPVFRNSLKAFWPIPKLPFGKQNPRFSECEICLRDYHFITSFTEMHVSNT